jgi:hypothetical protein
MTCPRLFLTSAVNCTDPPAGIEELLGVSAIEAGAGSRVTAMELEPTFPSLVALIVAVPAARPVITPEAFTEATTELLVDQVTVCPDSG